MIFNEPSEATFSRIFNVLSTNRRILDKLNEYLIVVIDNEFQILEEEIAIDATAIDAHTKATKKANKKFPSTKDQALLSDQELFESLPIVPSWGIKANSKGKNCYWFGYKGHLAVTSKSQYIVANLTTSAYVSDVNVAIPLIRHLKNLHSKTPFVLKDRGYDATAIYEECHKYHF